MVVVDRARNLEQTPSLIDPHVADKVRNAGAAVSRVNTGDERARRTIEADATAGRTTDRIDDLRAVEGVRAAVVDTQRRRHAVTELPRVLDVVDTGDRVVTADQERGVVARIAMPRRGVG